IVIDHLHRQSSGVSQPAPIAHFFCSRNPAEPERSDAREILRSLLKQVSLIEGEKTIRLPSLMCEIGRATPLTIVIDALDECNSQQRGIIIHALQEIRRQCRDVVKIFVSSRHEADIAAHFNEGEVSEVTASANEKDLNRFIGIQVESFVQRWSTIHEEPIQFVAVTTHDANSSRFLWVTLQLERICDMERIKDIDSIRQVLRSLPQTLNQSYELLYKRIQDMGEGPRTVALQSLQWLLCAKRKLSVSEFLAAVRKSPVKCTSISARSIIDYCCNLVVIDNVADTFRLAHVTVRE
ncbi:uncharacterized protein BO96DRAFT_352679, partial [Aspergillus niger CBS 101883]|uniref:uncharacterized protein n=1 Tax=Aspergillus lacticoffeatus (strain CBS 101883) TaxID=1450533 RepID=UPI000D801CD9